MKRVPFRGVCTALITPFLKDGSVDFSALGKLLSLQKQGGVRQVVLFGTTGESCTVETEEKKEVFLLARRMMPEAFLMMGCGSNDTKKAVLLAEKAKGWGADGVLAVTPYYNKCTQKGALCYYRTIAEVGLPVLAYNVPQRTGFDLAPETVKALWEEGTICGVKEACGDLKRGLWHANYGVPFYSGDDLLNLPFYSVGAEGAISVISNLLPHQAVEIWQTFAKDVRRAERLDRNLRPLLFALGTEVNPILIKYALSCFSLCEEWVRAPLTVGEKEHKKRVLKEMVRAKIL